MQKSRKDLRQLEEHIYFTDAASPFYHTVHHVHHPGSAWSALPARLVLVAATMLVLLSMTMTTPVPNPVCASFTESQSMLVKK
jgi:hypothetical protein